jgi:hypothetical protein
METEKLETLPHNAICVGHGVITWDRMERVSDRYGTVKLLTDGTESQAKLRKTLSGRGRLIAEVLDARQSGHIGDLFRGLFPRTQKTGDLIVLGEGDVFYDEIHGDVCIGLKPTDSRDSDWLNPRALYDVHESLVRLIFVKV